MGGRTDSSTITEDEFAGLLRTLSSSTKGRLFLAEYARQARPEATRGLLEALHRIEDSMTAVRDQLEPERLANELSRVAATLEIAVEGSGADPQGDEQARRMALVERARSELAALSASLGGRPRQRCTAGS